MILDLETHYSAIYVRPRKRSEETATLSGRHTVSVREVAEEDAPVAHRLREEAEGAAGRNRNFWSEGSRFLTGGEVRDVRVIDGHFHVDRCSAEDFRRLALLNDPDSPFSGFYSRPDGSGQVTAGVYSHYDGDRKVHGHDRASAEKMIGTETRKWTDLFRDTAEALDRRAASFAIVGGRVYERVGEPVFTVMDAGDRITVTFTEAVPHDDGFSKDGTKPSPLICQRFGIDEQDRAIGFARSMAETRAVPLRVLASAESVSPWSVRFRGERESLVARARHCCGALTDAVKSMDRMAGMAWLDLFEEAAVSDHVTARMVDAASRLAAMRGDMPETVEGRHFGATPSASSLKTDLRLLGEAVEAWDTRTRDGLEWSASSLSSSPTFSGELRASEITDALAADALAEKFGTTVSEMAASAASGDGSLVVVDDHSGPKAAFLIRATETGAETLAWATAHGAPPRDEQAELALGHVEKWSRHGRPLMDDLDAFGI